MELIAIPLLPLVGSIVLLLAGSRLGERGVAVVGVGSVLLAALLSAVVIADFSEPFTVTLASWFSVPGLSVDVGLHFDGLTAVMVGVITGVGFLLHWYSVGYMAGEVGFSRYFAYLNLFVAAMLVLVLADNLLLLYLGWEGVGLCSYLLIGFWYKDAANGYAARKAFVVTRVGDVALIVAVFILLQHFGTLQIDAVVELARQQWQGSPWASTVALLILLGAVGKSAQLPLQTWLPDAMAGPTPVSALIHAATMVTAGVYLIARTHGLFLLAPPVMELVALVGGLTLFLAACSALVQTDLKRILAYSTISQIGYMFFALGAGVFSAAVFHLMTHAFFKALLFLAAGQVILSLHHEQDIRRMGGLARQMPFSLVCFVIGAAALAALPLTSGFYSKDAILLGSYALAGATPAWLLALAGALITALYSLRMLLAVFFGPTVTAPEPDRRRTLVIPLAVLCVLSLVGATIPQPLDDVFGDRESGEVSGMVHVAVLITPWLGLALAWAWWRYGGALRERWADGRLAAWWRAGWGFDALYNGLLVRPLLVLAQANRRDVVDRLVAGIEASSRGAHAALSALQNGRLRWYGAWIAAGAIVTLAMVTT